LSSISALNLYFTPRTSTVPLRVGGLRVPDIWLDGAIGLNFDRKRSRIGLGCYGSLGFDCAGWSTSRNHLINADRPFGFAIAKRKFVGS
jgi:hypothetical protein